MEQKCSKWNKYVQIGTKILQMEKNQNGTIMIQMEKMEQKCSKWNKNAQNGTKCSKQNKYIQIGTKILKMEQKCSK